MKIVLVAPEPTFRFAFKAVVADCRDLELVADAPDARAGFQAVDGANPDLVVMDVALPGMNGIDATREVRRRAPRARVLLLAAWPRERDVLDGFAAGAHGFALKTDTRESLCAAMRAIADGRRFVIPGVRGITAEAAARAYQSKAVTKDPGDVLGALSSREREVFGLVVKGGCNRDIARELCISIKTVDTHRGHINRKLDCASTGDLVRFAAENGLLRRPPSALVEDAA